MLNIISIHYLIDTSIITLYQCIKNNFLISDGQTHKIYKYFIKQCDHICIIRNNTSDVFGGYVEYIDNMLITIYVTECPSEEQYMKNKKYIFDMNFYKFFDADVLFSK